MKISPLLASLAVAAALAGCTTQRAAAPATATSAPASTPAPAPVAPAATTSAASTGPAIDSSKLAADKQKADAEAALLRERTVHFDFDVATLRSEDLALLDAHGRYLAAHPGARVVLAGHTDERGTAEYNMALGEKRAKNARLYLLTHGAQAPQLEVVSYGEEKPLDRDSTEAAWAKNRRVELQYQKEAP